MDLYLQPNARNPIPPNSAFKLETLQIQHFLKKSDLLHISIPINLGIWNIDDQRIQEQLLRRT